VFESEEDAMAAILTKKIHDYYQATPKALVPRQN
jgi:hypothetical protein